MKLSTEHLIDKVNSSSFEEEMKTLCVSMLRSLPTDIPLPDVCVEEELPALIVFWDTSDLYIDAEIEEDLLLSVYIRNRKTKEEKFEYGISSKECIHLIEKALRG